MRHVLLCFAVDIGSVLGVVWHPAKTVHEERFACAPPVGGVTICPAFSAMAWTFITKMSSVFFLEIMLTPPTFSLPWYVQLIASHWLRFP